MGQAARHNKSYQQFCETSELRLSTNTGPIKDMLYENRVIYFPWVVIKVNQRPLPITANIHYQIRYKHNAHGKKLLQQMETDALNTVEVCTVNVIYKSGLEWQLKCIQQLRCPYDAGQS